MLVYASVDECVGVCAYVRVCVYAPVHEYVVVTVAVYVCVHPSIHTSMCPSRKLKLKIETIPKFKIQFPKLEIQNPISNLRLKLKLEFQNYFSKTY